MTLPELEKIREALVRALLHDPAYADDALDIIDREIEQAEQDQLLSKSKANPT
jgi:hypothetical protein